jgi:hypothetical protein
MSFSDAFDEAFDTSALAPDPFASTPSGMTPLEKAREFLATIEDMAPVMGTVLPDQRYAQLGQPVIACSSLIAAVTTTIPHAEYGGATGSRGNIFGFECNASQQSTFVISLARECSWTSDDTGFDIPEEVVKVSEQMQMDHDLLWYFAANLDAYLSKSWSISMVLMGGLSIVTLQLLTGVD